jgi:hypothetical protein
MPGKVQHSSGLYKKLSDGSLIPYCPEESRENGEMNGGDESEVFHVRRHAFPTAPWGAVLAFSREFGFKALVAVLALGLVGGAGYLVFDLVTWNRADTAVFVDAVKRNTDAIESMSKAQDNQTAAIREMDDKLLQHLEQDDEDKASRRR